MDLLVEKLNGSRYYLSQYKVLITDFEESAPSVTRNSKQLDQHNGNIDFGGWHTDKTINITGYYRADDMDDEETLRERLYALLSDPNGYYITQLKTSPETAVERPGETSGGYYEKLTDYPSHKRFLVYTEAPEMKLVGNVNGTLLYKLTAEFKTLKLPYGETPVVDVAINSPHKGVPVNLQPDSNFTQLPSTWTPDGVVFDNSGEFAKLTSNGTGTQRIYGAGNSFASIPAGSQYTISFIAYSAIAGTSFKIGPFNSANLFKVTTTATYYKFSATKNLSDANALSVILLNAGDIIYIKKVKLELGASASPWSPNPADPEYNSWYYGLTGNVSIPYSGTVPCNQLEQGFTVQLTAKGASSSLYFKIDDTELTYSGAVASGDVFMFSGFSYTQNGLSIVSKTNKAYFILQPDKPNRITCNVPWTVRILGFQNLYA